MASLPSGRIWISGLALLPALVATSGSTGLAQGIPPHHGRSGFIDPLPGFQIPGLLPGPSPVNQINFTPEILFGFGPDGMFAFSPTLTVVGPGGFAPTLGPTFPRMPGPNPWRAPDLGLNLPAPPRAMVGPIANRPAAPRANPAKSRDLVVVGDRSFRVRNLKRAEDKYKLAVRADPTAPGPHVHLAQVAMNRGDYSAAADHLRDAVTVAGDPGWLLVVPDIQAIFGEPADFARQVARLETHLQAHPTDRDAWFVLGAESYLSGRPRQALDVFQRLTDRKPDEALAAFLDASKPRADPGQ